VSEPHAVSIIVVNCTITRAGKSVNPACQLMVPIDEYKKVAVHLAAPTLAFPPVDDSVPLLCVISGLGVRVSCDDQMKLASIASNERFGRRSVQTGGTCPSTSSALPKNSAIVIPFELLARDLQARQQAAVASSFCHGEPAIFVAFICWRRRACFD
jgi:hypothetical protein